MKTTRLPVKLLCPKCGTLIDAATDVSADPRAPRAGDVTVCFYCAGVLHFRGEADALPSRVELIDADTFVELPVELRTRVKRLQAAILRRKKR